MPRALMFFPAAVGLMCRLRESHIDGAAGLHTVLRHPV